ncbi:MAG: hypothetical protein ACLUGA_11775 [Oscillospiraceae bacterium]
MLLLAAAAYLGLRPLLGEESPALPTPEPTAAAEPVTVEADGVVIRQESVLRGEGEYMLPLLPDGARAAAGEAIALVSDEPAAIEAARTRLRLSSELAAAVSGAEPEPEGALSALAAARASGDCAGLVSGAQDLGDALFGTSRELRAARLLSELAALPESDGAAELRAPSAGLVTSKTDGLERLAPGLLEDLTVTGLAELMRSEPEKAGDDSLRLVSGWRWYFAAPLAAKYAAALEPGERVTLTLPGLEVSARVESVSEPEGGRCAVVLSSTEAMDAALELRFCEACLSLDGGGPDP